MRHPDTARGQHVFHAPPNMVQASCDTMCSPFPESIGPSISIHCTYHSRHIRLWFVLFVSHLWPMGLNVLDYKSHFSTLTTRQSKVEFYLLTFSQFPLRTSEKKSCFDKNRTHDFRTNRCARLPTGPLGQRESNK